jgi:predicted helicase
MTLQEYIDKLNRKFKLGNSTEHTFRGNLENLIEDLIPDVSATNEPAGQKCGKPDYVLMRNNITLGYIEAKDIGEKDLEGNKQNKKQFDRYKSALNNLIFTDYLTFHFYRDGEKNGETLSIGKIENGSIVALPQYFDQFHARLKDFCTNTGRQTIRSSKKLSSMMAGKARLLSNVIEQALTQDINQEINSTLKDQMEAFKEILIHDISAEDFADIYAQTITYGMFAARLHDPTLPTFSRQEAAELIPKSNPFLRKLFGYIAGPDLDSRLLWIVDDLVEIFLACNVAEILKDYGKSTGMEDPIIHFYENFLSEYDPALRKARGVWYTPQPVVSFIVRAVDEILKTEFGLPQGLADTSKTTVKVQSQNYDKRTKKYLETTEEVHKVQILDPATGTGTFLAETIKHIHKKFAGQKGLWSNYVENHLLPRLNGFELLMASYAMAHLQLDLLLTETGYKPTKDQRFRVYLTNSLEEHHPDTSTLFANWLSSEANEANHIKRDTPVMVIMGNPPYSGESANKGEWIMKLMEDYKKEPGGIEKLNERNPKWINDDYVKFLRYAQYFIEKSGEGIVAFINPHGFLDNPTFRGMRWNLLKTYDKIYTLDLHGNSKKKETAPDGSADVNVFDIMQGVSINIFIKTGKKKANELGKVFHVDLFGKREFKYDFLTKNSLKTISYKELPNVAPNYFFANKDFEEQKGYDLGFSVNKLFTLNNVGIVTARDEFTIHHSKKEIEQTINKFLKLNDEDARVQFNLGKDVRDWQVNFARKDLQISYPNKGKFTEISYRPFDNRWTFYTGKSKGFHCYPRNEVMQHFLNKENIALTLCKQFKSGDIYQHIFITNAIIESSYVSNRTSEITSVLPLYVYPESQDLFSTTQRTPNLNQAIIDKMAEGLGLKFTPEKEKTKGTFAPIDVLDYIYAVLHSPNYREKYKEFLKIDFPRVSFPKDVSTFWKLVKLGGEIRQIHLLESDVVEEYITEYPETGDDVVEKIKYENGRVYINENQYFDKVSETAWNFYIGGYQPAQKWLKDRKGRILSYEDMNHYQKIIVALTETARLMGEIDLVGVE